MFREAGGTVVEKSTEIRCLQEGTLEKPAVHGHRQQVFWGGGVGVTLRGLQADFPFSHCDASRSQVFLFPGV